MKLFVLILLLFSLGNTVEDCKPVKCPDDLKDLHGFCHLSVRDLGDLKVSDVCKNCGGFITSNGGKWIHITFPKYNGGYIRCADHLAGFVCENPKTLTVAQPKGK